MALEGSRIALTGGAGGIGSRLAHGLVQRGADVLVIDRHEPVTQGVRFAQGDLGCPEGIEEAARLIAAERPDILINLAGVQYFGPFQEQDSASVLAHYLVNLVAPVRLAQAALPQMRRRRRGHIVNMGSVLGAINYPFFVTYSSAKAGLEGFSEALRREIREDGVDVTYIAARAVRTGMSIGRVERFAELTGMTLDDPDHAVRRIIEAIARRRPSVTIGLPEGVFAKLNALAPSLVDRVIVRQAGRARRLLGS